MRITVCLQRADELKGCRPTLFSLPYTHGNTLKHLCTVSSETAPIDLQGVASRLYAKHPVTTRWRQKMRLALCPFVPIIAVVPPGSRVLDVGCGDGLLLGLLMELGRASTAVGFDINAHRIRSARHMAETNGFEASAVFKHLGPKSAWPTENGLYDVVAMVDVMHHIGPAMHDRVWQQAADSLRPGGLFVCKDMAKRPRWMAAANCVHDLVFSADWVHYPDFESGVRLARKIDLVMQQEIGYSRLWYRHELRVFVRL